jgi:hypothetical protein
MKDVAFWSFYADDEIFTPYLFLFCEIENDDDPVA